VLQPNACYGLLIHEVFLDHTQTTQHSRQDSSGRVSSSSQRALPENTQHPEQTDNHDTVGFETTISAGERPQTYALESAATETGAQYSYRCVITHMNTWARPNEISRNL